MPHTHFAAIRPDGHPLDLTDLAEFIAAVTAVGVPANAVPLLDVAGSDDDQPRPGIAVGVLITAGQAAALPDHIEITELSDEVRADLDILEV